MACLLLVGLAVQEKLGTEVDTNTVVRTADKH